jgi:hypothetical protein
MMAGRLMAEQNSFDVFLSHSGTDKVAVEALANRLADEARLKPFLDKWHLVPGNPWQRRWIILAPARCLSAQQGSVRGVNLRGEHA